MKRMLKWYYGQATIRKKLVISYLVLVLLPLLVLGFYSYHTAKKNLLAQTRAAIQSNVKSMEYNLKTSLEREEDNLKYLSYNTVFRERLEAGRKNRTALAQEMNRSVEPVFWYFITSDRNMKGIEIYSSYIDEAMGSFLKTEESCAGERWYEWHKENFNALWTCADGKIFTTRTILDAASSSQPIGIIKLEVYPDRLLSPLYQPQFLNNGVLLLDEQKRSIGHREIANAALENDITERILSMEETGLYETDEYMLYAGEPFDNGWRVFYYVDKREIAGDMHKILRTSLWVVGVCLLIITVLISVISRILSTRILKLKQSTEKVGSGEFDITVESGYTDEIGVLAKSFEVMNAKINDMMEENYRMGLEKRATELKALQAMINPHFLYNCLSSIKWKAIRAEQDEIADVTGLLAKFYRTTLNEGRQITTVKNELENIRSYLELQSRTHDNSFTVEYQIAEDGLDFEIPNFLLQPIAENAICHGVDYCEEGRRGEIRIVYEVQEDYLLFHVYNNGPLIEESQLTEILNTPVKGYGIYNIKERIRMYYDESCGVFASVTDGLVCFTVKLRKEIEKV